jgi:uncharacterized protein
VTLRKQLEADLRQALRSGDEARKSALRLLLSAVRNAEVPPKPDDLPEPNPEREDLEPQYQPSGPTRAALGDDAIQQIVRREVKQRRDSIEAYTKARRGDLAAKEEAEIAVLSAYLPPQMSSAEIEEAARSVIARVGAQGPADKGKVVPVIMSELQDKAEGREINAVVTRLLSEPNHPP